MGSSSSFPTAFVSALCSVHMMQTLENSVIRVAEAMGETPFQRRGGIYIFGRWIRDEG